MKGKRDITDYINDIIDAIESIEEFSFDYTFEEFKNDKNHFCCY
jgi:uncharacterized protein with HEPN domain